MRKLLCRMTKHRAGEHIRERNAKKELVLVCSHCHDTISNFNQTYGVAPTNHVPSHGTRVWVTADGMPQ